MAIQVLDLFNSTNPPTEVTFESSELEMYKAYIAESSGQVRLQWGGWGRWVLGVGLCLSVCLWPSVC